MMTTIIKMLSYHCYCLCNGISKYSMSQRTTKPTKWHVRPAKTQISLGIRKSDQSLRCCSQWVAIKIRSFLTRTAKTLVRLGGCPGWSESSLGAHAILLVLSCAGSYRRCRGATITEHGPPITSKGTANKQWLIRNKPKKSTQSPPSSPKSWSQCSTWSKHHNETTNRARH